MGLWRKRFGKEIRIRSRDLKGLCLPLIVGRQAGREVHAEGWWIPPHLDTFIAYVKP